MNAKNQLNTTDPTKVVIQFSSKHHTYHAVLTCPHCGFKLWRYVTSKSGLTDLDCVGCARRHRLQLSLLVPLEQVTKTSGS